MLDSAGLGIGRPIAFQSPSVHGKDTSKPLENHIGERRWHVVGYSKSMNAFRTNTFVEPRVGAQLHTHTTCDAQSQH